MIVCAANEISKMYGGNQIFENISFEIKTGERIGIVGQNGSGKTTIFKLLSGIEQPDSGEIHLQKGCKVGYLAQIPSFEASTTVLDVLQHAFSHVKKLEQKMKKLERAMANEQNQQSLELLLEEYGTVQQQFTNLGGYEIEAEIMKVANGLGIEAMLEQRFNELSGGEKTKVGLGLVILQQPSLLLLDEPTNHLDIDAVEWLEQYLTQYEGTVFVISHDRYFLDQIVTKIYDLEAGELSTYHCNYSAFVKEKEERLLAEFAAYEEQQKKIKKMRETIKRLKEWANRANPPNEGLHKRAKNMERAIERMEKLKRPILERKKMALSFNMGDRSGKDVIVIDQICKKFEGKKLFNDASMYVRFRDRVAIVGHNGSGKTTLLKMILGNEQVDEGAVKVGNQVKIGYLSQQLKYDNKEESILQHFCNEVPISQADARHILARFMFYGQDVFKKVSSLSGGERMRLRLAQLMQQQLNVLILDEPTNHLDIDSREVLEDAIEDFDGTLICVSHDRYLLNKCFKVTYWIEDYGLTRYEGSYDEAKGKRKELSLTPAKAKSENHYVKKTMISVNKQETVTVQHIEIKVEALEDEINKIEQLMEQEFELTNLLELQQKRELLSTERDDLYETLDEML
ncbi:ribosomal protection-like ABC-F family protein [Cytobacillus sp. IB215316]|uniref:ribosomal protection-like ABC-F family protein n=1 Tax=Cytobacillus sp. IB215316 TaxID=3097354 RepID=UPI002A0FECE2|nr:ABC-F type ribosomal protection protein [Cytobacillus sp. IB215316]MDX8361282.1 ABC-F type ribosomal protection protein [Cytobacillus sp. IB215316]